MKIKIITVLERLEDKNGTNKQTGKAYTIRRARVLAAVEGVNKEITISSFNPLEIGDGTELEITTREYNGQTQYEVARAPYAGKPGGGGGYGKTPWTIAELDALMAHATAECKKSVLEFGVDLNTPHGVELLQKLISTYIIAAADHGAKVGGPTPGNGSAPTSTAAPIGDAGAKVRELMGKHDFTGNDAKKKFIDGELGKTVTAERAEDLIRMINNWKLPALAPITEDIPFW